MQLNNMISQAHKTRQDFFAYLLGMAVSEAQAIIDCAHQEAWLQKGIKPEIQAEPV
ncbi:hypothetical protein P8H26_05780 [Pseudochrobactrum sp. sp1633]|uniref:hypothetical protein n=1 Tax=Pseudochrobactrum sp. sp1633 TaxID=3036706 RepID=UPI0025A4F0E9|nr:hypothetical protein [Pseudochrobactrum sp. sp1633]MDM8344897.1 hypothetical protein [Pseudochrobactrum sp. sp1633]HWD14730.1 hypothetical protein [Pseudochrobactrum sp.]